VKVLAGSLAVTGDQVEILSQEEIAEGWRLACRCNVTHDITIEMRQWEAAILADNTPFEFTPAEGFGIAIDVGTTTLVAQLVDLRSGHVLGVQTGLNPQVSYGADIMSRVHYAAAVAGREKLRAVIHSELGEMIRRLLSAAHRSPESIHRVALVGNTVMHHLFAGIDVEPLARYPFEPFNDGVQRFSPSSLGWNLPSEACIWFLPCLGGFVGSDILAGILAVRMHDSDSLQALIDLGTNGEVVIGNREFMLCASTAAGPAFEGARIRMGMRAATGAISEVTVSGESLKCRVLGGGEPRGICGSGLVDAAAAGLDLGIIQPGGRLTAGAEWTVCAPVSLVQNDIRELQLAKGAIAAAVRLLLQNRGAARSDIEKVYLAGAFGNYVSRASARRIGLIDFGEPRVCPAGNTALLGAKVALFAPDQEFGPLLRRIRHVPLAADPEFQDIFVECMSFPGHV
jgi:uncharacterized 2Fe-2S/4Fe-4S cluster protein (DUF4445 family)